MIPRQLLLLPLLASLLLLAGAVQAQRIRYVSPSGSDSASGLAPSPYLTLSRALQDNPNIVLMESGQYQFLSTLTVAPNVAIIGGFKPVLNDFGETVWIRGYDPTFLLFVGQPGVPGMRLGTGAQLEHVTAVGGFYSVQLDSGAQVREVEFFGAQLASVYVRGDGGQNAAWIYRCRILGGNSGIQVEQGGRVTITETVVEDVQGRGLQVIQGGMVTVEDSVFQRCGVDGIAASGTNGLTLRNVVARRNTSAGILLTQSSALVQGALVTQNDVGIRIENATPVIEHATVAGNRGSGIRMDRGLASVRSSIIADNARWGIEELTPSTALGQPDPTAVVGGAMVSNMFHANVVGAYVDGGTTPVLTADGINFELVNSGTSSGNMFADPRFIDAVVGDYRLAEGSPALDRVVPPLNLLRDLDGDLRNVDFPDVGSGFPDATDLGAYERQQGFSRRFKTLFGDRGTLVAGNTVLSTLVNPQWFFLKASPFIVPSVQFRPGGIRMYSETEGTFGTVAYEGERFAQPGDSVAIFNFILTQFGEVGAPSTRFRISGPSGEVSYLWSLGQGSDEITPSVDGSTYQTVLDMRQGPARLLGDDGPSSYTLDLFLELLDFEDTPVRTPRDLIGVTAEVMDRELYEARFTQQAANWTFNSGLEGWGAFTIPGVFTVPVMRYSSARQALEVFINRDLNTFGAWISPNFLMPPGAEYRIEFKVSTSAPVELVPSLRVRMGSSTFEFSHETVITAQAGGVSLPEDEARSYILYGKLPDDFDAANTPCAIAFDGFGFGAGTRGGSLFLEEVTVTTTPATP